MDKSVGGAGVAMMDHPEIFEAAGPPPQHIRFHFIDRVPAGCRYQSADCLPTSLSVNLGCASDMEPGTHLEFWPTAPIVVDFSTANPQVRLFPEMLETILEIIRRKAEVAVQLHEKIPVVASEGAISVIESIHNAPASFPETTVRSVDGTDPWEITGIPIDDRAGPVGGAVVHYHPFHRTQCLIADGLDGRFNVAFLVSYGGDDHITSHCACPFTQNAGTPR